MNACNNSRSTEEKPVDSIITVSPDSNKKTAAIGPGIDLMALPAYEMKDDSVFADGSIAVSWSNAGFTDNITVKKFLRKLQYWVDTDQGDRVAITISYPSGKAAVKDKKSFLKDYDNIFNQKVEKALREQNFSQIFRNTRGILVGRGELWIN